MATGGAYCKKEDIYEITNTISGKEITDAEVWHWIERAVDDIDSCLAGIYNVPFAVKQTTFEWNASDNIPPLIRKWCQKLAGGYIIRKLFTARAGKNRSPYSDELLKECEEYCEKLKDGELNLLDVNGNIIPRLEAGATQATTPYSTSLPYPATHVMPDMHEPYPNLEETGEGDDDE